MPISHALPLRSEHALLLNRWNATEQSYPEAWFPQLFAQQVERTPDAVALVFEQQQLTYRDLNAQANQLAHHLQSLGVGPEVMVGLCVQRSTEMIVGLLGILKAGGVYVPLDPEYPRERLAFLLTDTQMPVVVTQHHLIPRLPKQQMQVVCLDRAREMIAQQSEANPVSGITGEHLAYGIYTSGSTGQPKGVLIDHRALAVHCWSCVQTYELQAEDAVLALPDSSRRKGSDYVRQLRQAATAMRSREFEPTINVDTLLERYRLTEIEQDIAGSKPK